jgi:hypothetical protein
MEGVGSSFFSSGAGEVDSTGLPKRKKLYKAKIKILKKYATFSSPGLPQLPLPAPFLRKPSWLRKETYQKIKSESIRSSSSVSSVISPLTFSDRGGAFTVNFNVSADTELGR